MKFFEAINEEILSEATIESVIKNLKKIEKQKKEGMFKTTKYFNSNELEKLFKEFSTIENVSGETLVPILKKNGFSDQQISQLKPFIIKKITARNERDADIRDISSKANRTGEIRRSGSVIGTGVTGSRSN